MNKPPTSKQDQLRAMREAKFANTKPLQKFVKELRSEIAAIPAKKPSKKPRARK